MFQLVGSVLSSFGESWFGHQVDTFVDKLNRNLTVFLFIVFAVLVSAQQYVGNPIHCRVQSTQDGNFETYMNEICWVTNTYYIPKGEVIRNQGVDEYRRINYYQWVPLVLLVQALMFYLPHLFWQGMLLHSGLDMGSIVSTGRQVHSAENSAERGKKLHFMAEQLNNYLTHYQRVETGILAKCSAKFNQVFNRLLCGKRQGSYIVFIFIFTKALYVANAVGQFFILDSFLSADIHSYGWNVFRSILLGNNWPESEIFPKSTMCTFNLHALGGEIHKQVVQCVLPVNFFHDKLYIVIWFWLVIVAVASCLSLLYWIVRSLFRVDRVRYVNHHLRALEKVFRGKEKSSTPFITNYLKQDGVLVLKLVNLNVSGLVCAQLAGVLWDKFKRENASNGFHPVRDTEEEEGFAEV